MKKKYTIGLFTDYILVNYQKDFYIGVVERARELNINVVAFHGGSIDTPRYYRQTRNFIFDFVDPRYIQGIVSPSGSLGNNITSKELIDFYSTWKPLPIVSVGAILEGYPSIVVNNKTGFRELVLHLIDCHQCKKIAFLKGPEDVYDAIERFEAYKEALKMRDIKYDDSLVVSGNFTDEAGRGGVQILLDQRKVSFDALAAANDLMAIYAQEELIMRGIDVPSEVGVIGFDNALDGMNITPMLSTVEQPIKEMASLGVDTLVTLMEGAQASPVIPVDTKMIIRNSCGCNNNTRILSENDFSSLFRMRNEHSFYRAQQLIEELNITSNIDEIKQVLDNQFNKLGINLFYIALYLNDGNIKPFYLQYNDRYENIKNLIDMDEIYSDNKFLPGDYPDSSLAILPLYFKTKPLGFIIMDIKEEKIFLYELLTTQLSNSLKGVAVAKELKEYTQKLEMQINESSGELNKAWKELQKNADQSGLAEIATGILHNFGNILLTIKTSSSMIRQENKFDLVRKLEKANALLAEFLDKDDEKSTILVKYYKGIAESLQLRTSITINELEVIDRRVQLLEDTIETQRNYTTHLDMKVANLITLIDDALTIAQHNLFKINTIVLKKYNENDVLKINCRKSQVFNILINLFKNGYESMVMHQSTIRELIVDAFQEKDEIFVTVTDNGVGIPADKLEEVFHYGFSTKTGSRGFGLHITRKFMEEMNGYIKVKSEGLGKGACFTLSFPALIG